MITVLNKSKTDLGFYIGRPSIFGNPFEIGVDGARAEVIEKYIQIEINIAKMKSIYK